MEELFHSTDITSNPAFMNYISEVGNAFCPFIEPATQRDILFFSEYDLKGFELENFQAAIFYIGLMHTEFLRKERKRQETRMQHDLLCENTIFYLPPEIEITGQELFGWPHWLLKLLYTRFSVLFGKFWKGEEATSRDGKAIPVPTEHFLSIRSAIKPMDARFFLLAPQLTDAYLNSCDDGASAFQNIPLQPPPAILEAELVGNQPVSRQLFLNLLREMLKTTFYAELKQWGLDELEKAKA